MRPYCLLTRKAFNTPNNNYTTYKPNINFGKTTVSPKITKPIPIVSPSPQMSYNNKLNNANTTFNTYKTNTPASQAKSKAYKAIYTPIYIVPNAIALGTISNKCNKPTKSPNNKSPNYKTNKPIISNNYNNSGKN